MRKKAPVFFMLLFLSFQAGLPEISSLSQVFLPGKGIQDTDNDGFGDRVSLQIIIPSDPSECELAVAAEIAARANLESLALNFSMVKKESAIHERQKLLNPILIGNDLKWIKELQGKDSLEPYQGLVTVFSYKGLKGISLTAHSKKALLQTGRSFFLRWPYLWDIWGREQGATYFSVEKDLHQFLTEEGINFNSLAITAALYEFRPRNTAHETLERLDFDLGEIKQLTVEIEFGDRENKQKAYKALEHLKLLHSKGEKTSTLTYLGCARICFELKEKSDKTRIVIRRPGYPKRILTPSYRKPFKVKDKGKDFDLLSLFSTRGFYADRDKDKILDNTDTMIIIPQDSRTEGIVQLASRLVLNTAGASFPLILLDREVKENKSLLAPILIGENNLLIQELLKTGKLNLPTLRDGYGLIKVIPRAFNKSSALAVVSADAVGMEKTLLYFSQIFPYLNDYDEGTPQLQDVLSGVKEFLTGRHGSAEAYFSHILKKVSTEIKKKELEYFKAEFYLPQKDGKFEEHVKKYMKDNFHAENLAVETFTFSKSKIIFEKEKEFPWEGDEIAKLIKGKIKKLKNSNLPLRIEAAVSESPEIRMNIKKRIEELLTQNGITKFKVTVLSAFKQGFFWLLEEILPSLEGKKISRLVVKFSEEKEDFSQLKRFYSEPYRWLQQLYPADEILSRKLNLSLESVEFRMKQDQVPVYEVTAYDEKNTPILNEVFSPRWKKIPFLKVLPEWGTVKITTGWLRMERGSDLMVDTPIKVDLQKFWDFYQDEILFPLYSYVMKKTGTEPTFSKQPYFKRLLVEAWFSEPDYKLGLDEEIISSLESIHDEIYFDTLDFLRGITEIEIEEENDIPEDTSRYSAPGNVLPLIHPSLEGAPGKVKVVLEDWVARSPRLELKWKEKGKEEIRKKIAFPSLKAKSIKVPQVIFNARRERLENLLFELELDKEEDYLSLIEIICSARELQESGCLEPVFCFPKLNSITLKVKQGGLEKEEVYPVVFQEKERKLLPSQILQGKDMVPTDKIISPQMCLDIVNRLSRNRIIRTYTAGNSYEKRKIPVLEIFTPPEKYVSLPRLITFKPTLYISGRQHANEISSTNYILKLAELLAVDENYREFTKKMNIVLHPMENPDGAELAYNLQKLTPFHSLHAGRYTSLGIDVGYQVNVSKPLLPEAKIRGNLYKRWQPDIYLNLHGYPSHEWVQQFSGYSPYLFRDYWIPRGWFAYYRSLRLSLYQNRKKAGNKLKEFIIREMTSDRKTSESNKKFYDRYFRWAARWQPHMNYLEVYDDVNLYAKRRSAKENKLSERRRVTFVEETPELMDETARGEWLNFLCQQGIAYLRAHLKYLAQSEYETARIEEEINNRIHIQFKRSRPPIPNSE